MRTISRAVAVLAGLASLLVFSAVAIAANPHFIGTPTATVSGDSLTVSFKAAGLGNAQGATFNLTGTVQVYSRCYNRGGNKPQADNKQETIDINQTETFPVRNGQTTGSFTVTAPPSTLTCPGNQVVVVESVDYSDLVLTGEGLTHAF
jgi:hypothetical protein